MARHLGAGGGARLIDARAAGASGDGRRDDTAALQAAIDAAAGGGTVVVPPGVYRVGTLRLRGRLRFELTDGATLRASRDDSDFAPPSPQPDPPIADLETADHAHAVLAGRDLCDVVIAGGGTIDGDRDGRGGPKPIALRGCRGVRLERLQVRRSGSYAVALCDCDDVVVDGVRVAGSHADGIDLDACRRVRLTACDVEAVDDGICLKASGVAGASRWTEDVVVERCRVRGASIGLKLGSESATGFRRVVVRDCALEGWGGAPVPVEIAEDGGVALEVVDGGTLEDVLVTDVVMRDVGTPLFVRLGDRWRAFGATRPGVLRRVLVRRLRATGARAASSITGLPDARVAAVVLDDVRIGVVARPLAPPLGTDAVPEAPFAYPRPDMFGTLPASVLYCRHVDALALRDVVLERAAGDDRPAMLCNDAGRDAVVARRRR